MLVLAVDWTSSPSSVDWHFLLVQNNLDLGSTSELEGLEALEVLSLDLSENVVVRIKLLSLIFVGFNTNFIVMGAVVLPLRGWLNIEELHEVVKLDFVVLAFQFIVVHEEPVLSTR